MVHSLGRLRALPAVRRLLRARPAFFAAIIPIHLFAAEIRGVVVDAMGGEPLARVRIDLLNTDLRTTTDPQGHFRFASVPAGNYTLRQFPLAGWDLTTVSSFPVSVAPGASLSAYAFGYG